MRRLFSFWLFFYADFFLLGRVGETDFFLFQMETLVEPGLRRRFYWKENLIVAKRGAISERRVKRSLKRKLVRGGLINVRCVGAAQEIPENLKKRENFTSNFSLPALLDIKAGTAF